MLQHDSGEVWFGADKAAAFGAQGESNVGDMNATRSYACWFPDMIDFFRAQFQLPDLFFGWVQLSTWCIGATRQIAAMRQGPSNC